MIYRNKGQIQLNIMNFVACRFKCILSNVPTVQPCFKFKKFPWHRGEYGIIHSEHWTYQSTQKHNWSTSVSTAGGKRQRTWWERSGEERQEGKQTECHATKSHHITGASSQIYAHFASEHQPRRQKICKRELLISTDRKTLEKVILRLRCLGAKIFVVNMTHEFQAMSTIQEIIELIILQVSPT